MDSSRSHDPRLYRAAQPQSTYPYENGQQPPKRTSSSPQPQGPSAVYPYDTRPPVQQQPPAPVPPPRYEPQQRQQPRGNPAPRRLAGVLAFLVLTALSLPVHIGAIFFIYVEFESPGDPAMAALLVGAAFLGSFLALLVTGVVAQKVGGFPGRWRARITFAVLSGIIGLAVAYFAALVLF